MSFIGAPGSEDRKKFLAICGFAIVAAGVLYYELSGPSTPTAPPPPPVIVTAPAAGATERPGAASGARSIGTTAAALDPTLHTQPMLLAESVIYDGTGRNIFSAVSAPVVAIPKPIAPARPVAAVQAPPAPSGPPPLPPIDLKFTGYFGTPGSTDRQIILVHGDDVVLAHEGDVVLRRYKVLSISPTSIEVEDMPNNNRQTLPLIN